MNWKVSIKPHQTFALAPGNTALTLLSGSAVMKINNKINKNGIRKEKKRVKVIKSN